MPTRPAARSSAVPGSGTPATIVSVSVEPDTVGPYWKIAVSWVAVKTNTVKPGKGGAYNQVELKNLVNGTKLNERFRSDENPQQS